MTYTDLDVLVFGIRHCPGCDKGFLKCIYTLIGEAGQLEISSKLHGGRSHLSGNTFIEYLLFMFGNFDLLEDHLLVTIDWTDLDSWH